MLLKTGLWESPCLEKGLLLVKLNKHNKYIFVLTLRYAKKLLTNHKIAKVPFRHFFVQTELGDFYAITCPSHLRKKWQFLMSYI
jgi:hypothetical protein